MFHFFVVCGVFFKVLLSFLKIEVKQDSHTPPCKHAGVPVPVLLWVLSPTMSGLTSLDDEMIMWTYLQCFMKTRALISVDAAIPCSNGEGAASI